MREKIWTQQTLVPRQNRDIGVECQFCGRVKRSRVQLVGLEGCVFICLFVLLAGAREFRRKVRNRKNSSRKCSEGQETTQGRSEALRPRGAAKCGSHKFRGADLHGVGKRVCVEPSLGSPGRRIKEKIQPKKLRVGDPSPRLASLRTAGNS